jgi:phosphoglycolate phosphatase
MIREPADWPRAVVFDLDGTLIDSAGDLRDALNYAIGLRNLPPFSLPEVKEMIGAGIGRLVERALRRRGAVDLDPAPVAASLIGDYREHLTVHTVLYEGAAELLERLKGEGRLLGLCTNKKHELSVEILERLGIARFFGAVQGEREGKPRKPDPWPLLSVLETLGIPAQDAVMVGDGGADVKCAKAADMASVVVRGGYAHGDVNALGAAAVIDGLASLPECLARLRAGKE